MTPTDELIAIARGELPLRPLSAAVVRVLLKIQRIRDLPQTGLLDSVTLEHLQRICDCDQPFIHLFERR